MATEKVLTRAAWQKRSDRGPHLAYLPSGPDPDHDLPVKFVVADLSALLRAGHLPEELQVPAELMDAHEGGADGYMQDLVQTAVMRDADAQATIAGAVATARKLTHHLIAEMLVEPKVTAEEVAGGIFPELDMRMLVEFATRQRNVDAAGRRLPIIVPHEEPWARFRFERDDAAGAGDGAANGDAPGGPVPDGDGGGV